MSYNPYYFSDSESESSDEETGYETEGAEESQDEGSVDVDGDIEMAGSDFGASEFGSTAGSRPSSPNPSVISITDSIRSHIYKEEYGRGFNNYSEVYRLPADEAEWIRLDQQHRMIIDIMGAKYPPPMGPILESTIPREKKVLDLGCGNGAWVKDISRDFPFCDAVGVDLVPLEDIRDMPPNLRSEVDDINLGLSHFYDKFDVVHARLISSGIEDYRLLVERISRILRPGGLVELCEVDFTIYDRFGRRIPVSTRNPPGPPWWTRFMAHMNDGIRASGGDVDAANHLRAWVSDHEAFENAVYREVWLPAIPGNDARYHPNVYSSMRDNIIAFLKSGRPLLLANGVPEEEYNLIEQETIKELHESLVPQYTRLQCIYATRKHGVILENDV